MKNEIFDNNSETNTIKRIFYEEESEVNMIQEEIKKLNKNNSDLNSDKKNLLTTIIIIKKQVSRLKERLKKEDEKSHEFMLEISNLINQNKK